MVCEVWNQNLLLERKIETTGVREESLAGQDLWTSTASHVLYRYELLYGKIVRDLEEVYDSLNLISHLHLLRGAWCQRLTASDKMKKKCQKVYWKALENVGAIPFSVFF